MQLVLTNVNGAYKSSVTKMWEVFLGDGIIKTSGAVHLYLKTNAILYILYDSLKLDMHMQFFIAQAFSRKNIQFLI